MTFFMTFFNGKKEAQVSYILTSKHTLSSGYDVVLFIKAFDQNKEKFLSS